MDLSYCILMKDPSLMSTVVFYISPRTSFIEKYPNSSKSESSKSETRLMDSFLNLMDKIY